MCGYFGPKLAGWPGKQAGPLPTKKGYTIEEKNSSPSISDVMDISLSIEEVYSHKVPLLLDLKSWG